MSYSAREIFLLDQNLARINNGLDNTIILIVKTLEEENETETLLILTDNLFDWFNLSVDSPKNVQELVRGLAAALMRLAKIEHKKVEIN